MPDFFKCRLVEAYQRHKCVVMDVSPDLTESRQVNYESQNLTHGAASFHVWQNTPSRTFNLASIKLVSRTQEEAQQNTARINVLRGWCMPVFGVGSTGSGLERLAAGSARSESVYYDNLYRNEGRTRTASVNERTFAGGSDDLFYSTENSNIGSPPPLLYFSAYSNLVPGQAYKNIPTPNIYEVPTVIQNLSINYPSDIDYIPNRQNEPVPTILTLDITLLETHSPHEMTNRFSLRQFKSGMLINF